MSGYNKELVTINFDFANQYKISFEEEIDIVEFCTEEHLTSISDFKSHSIRKLLKKYLRIDISDKHIIENTGNDNFLVTTVYRNMYTGLTFDLKAWGGNIDTFKPLIRQLKIKKAFAEDED